jgi:PAS domain S-box-containing protein
MALMAGLPGALVAFVLLWIGDYSAKVQWTLSLFFCPLVGFAFALRERVVIPLQTLSTCWRPPKATIPSGRAVPESEPLGEVQLEVNTLERLCVNSGGALEATTLLRTVMEEIDVAVFAFDGERHLRLVNRTGERLLAQPAERLLGRSAADLNLTECLEGPDSHILHINFPGGSGRWGVRRSSFRKEGHPLHMLVLSDLSRTLREEERLAWQRLLRVLG